MILAPGKLVNCWDRVIYTNKPIHYVRGRR